MNEDIIESYIEFQVADYDDDLVGIFKAMVNWLIKLNKLLPELPEIDEPNNFHKIHPHHPRMELRKNYRGFLSHAVRRQEEADENIKIANLVVAIFAGAYIYHMPVKRMMELAKGEFIDRKQSEKELLDDDMSPNWLKEPSGRDFSAIML